jgi:hypothetical protein
LSRTIKFIIGLSWPAAPAILFHLCRQHRVYLAQFRHEFYLQLLKRARLGLLRRLSGYSQYLAHFAVRSAVLKPVLDFIYYHRLAALFCAGATKTSSQPKITPPAQM